MPALGLGALVVAGLIGVTISRNSEMPTDLGFDTKGIVIMDLALPTSTYKSEPDANKFFDALMERMGAVPGIIDVGGIDIVPPRETAVDSRVTFEPDSSSIPSIRRVVTGSYFRSLGIPLKLGRMFDERDGQQSDRVVMISEGLAALDRGTDPIGRRVTVQLDANVAAPPLALRVVGVVGDVPYSGQSAESKSLPHVYVPASQNPVRQMTIVAKTSMTRDSAAQVVRAVVSNMDARLPAPTVADLDDVVAASLSRPRFGSAMLAVLATAAVLLAGVGVFVMKNYLVRVGFVGAKAENPLR